MHRGLQIPEIVELVCIELAEDLPRYGAGPPQCQHLAALARTCKTFQDPALDLLWSHQKNTMKNLLMCMPNDLWHSPVTTDVKLLVRSLRNHTFRNAHREIGRFSAHNRHRLGEAPDLHASG